MNEIDLNDISLAVANRLKNNEGSDNEATRAEHETAKAYIAAAFAEIAKGLCEAQRVELHGIGVFRLESRAARAGVLPNGELWNVPPRFELVFNPSPDYALSIAEEIGEPVY